MQAQVCEQVAAGPVNRRDVPLMLMQQSRKGACLAILKIVLPNPTMPCIKISAAAVAVWYASAWQEVCCQ
jgi:hypothetical protein